MASFQQAGCGGNPSSRGRRRMSRPDNPRVQLSKRLTYALRHGANEQGLRLRPDGYVPLDELLGNPKFRGVSVEQVEEVVALDAKGRMTLTPDAENGRLLIRANQGHSVAGLVDEEQLLTKIVDANDVPVCVHGTSLKNWPSIRDGGLRRMNRHHVHFAAGLPGERGVISGMRASCQVMIYVDVGAAMAEGLTFFRSSNNVILTAGKDGTVSPCFFSRVDGVPDFDKPKHTAKCAGSSPANSKATAVVVSDEASSATLSALGSTPVKPPPADTAETAPVEPHMSDRKPKKERKAGGGSSLARLP